jgi:hypothetical protein
VTINYDQPAYIDLERWTFVGESGAKGCNLYYKTPLVCDELRTFVLVDESKEGVKEVIFLAYDVAREDVALMLSVFDKEG